MVTNIGVKDGCAVCRSRQRASARPASHTHVCAGVRARALELVCIMYAGFERIEPGMDIGVDLGEEYGMAEKMMAEECKE